MSEITVDFYRGIKGIEMETVVVFHIPDSAQILTRDPEEFMHWCYAQMMAIGREAKKSASVPKILIP
jgi:hypothetical protein